MTGQFFDPLIVRAYAKGTIYTAPKYFITDLASTPWLVQTCPHGHRGSGVRGYSRLALLSEQADP